MSPRFPSPVDARELPSPRFPSPVDARGLPSPRFPSPVDARELPSPRFPSPVDARGLPRPRFPSFLSSRLPRKSTAFSPAASRTLHSLRSRSPSLSSSGPWAMTCETAFCMDEMRSFAVLEYVSLPWGDHPTEEIPFLFRESPRPVYNSGGTTSPNEASRTQFCCEHLGALAIDQTRQETTLDGVAQCVPELCPQTAVVCSSWRWNKVVPPERDQVGQNLPARSMLQLGLEVDGPFGMGPARSGSSILLRATGAKR